jgi:hypothetical protein
MSQLGPSAAEWELIYGELVRAFARVSARLGDSDPDLAAIWRAMERFRELIDVRRSAERDH